MLTPPSNQTIQEFEDVHFSCAFSGKPRPTIHWFKDISSNLLKNTSTIHITSSGSWSRLTIRRGHIGHEGMYICVANNTLGTVSGKAYLSVTSKYLSVWVSRSQRYLGNSDIALASHNVHSSTTKFCDKSSVPPSSTEKRCTTKMNKNYPSHTI